MKALRLLLPLVLLSLSASAQEKIALTTPETKPSNAEYRLRSLTLTSDNPATAAIDEGEIIIELAGQNDEVVFCRYGSATTPTGTFLINALNKANLSSAYNKNATTGSLKQRIAHRLGPMNEAPDVCGGKSLAGTVSGNPQ